MCRPFKPCTARATGLRFPMSQCAWSHPRTLKTASRDCEQVPDRKGPALQPWAGTLQPKYTDGEEQQNGKREEVVVAAPGAVSVCADLRTHCRHGAGARPGRRPEHALG